MLLFYWFYFHSNHFAFPPILTDAEFWEKKQQPNNQIKPRNPAIELLIKCQGLSTLWKRIFSSVRS